MEDLKQELEELFYNYLFKTLAFNSEEFVRNIASDLVNTILNYLNNEGAKRDEYDAVAEMEAQDRYGEDYDWLFG